MQLGRYKDILIAAVLRTRKNNYTNYTGNFLGIIIYVNLQFIN